MGCSGIEVVVRAVEIRRHRGDEVVTEFLSIGLTQF